MRQKILLALCEAHAAEASSQHHYDASTTAPSAMMHHQKSPLLQLCESLLTIEAHRDTLPDGIATAIVAIQAAIDDVLLPQLRRDDARRALHEEDEALNIEEQEVQQLLAEVDHQTGEQTKLIQAAAKKIPPTGGKQLADAIPGYCTALDSILTCVQTLHSMPTAPPAVRDECDALRDALHHHRHVLVEKVAPLALQCAKAIDGRWLLLQQALQELRHCTGSVRWALRYLFDALEALESHSSASSPTAGGGGMSGGLVSSEGATLSSICDVLGLVEEDAAAAGSKRGARQGSVGKPVHFCGSPESARVASITTKKLGLPEGCPTVEAYAASLVQQAISTRNLALMYEGWTAWI